MRATKRGPMATWSNSPMATWFNNRLVRVSTACLAASLALATGSAAQGSVEGNSARTSGGARWGADYFPNVPLTSHKGEELRFFDDLIEGKVVVINFIYTTCPDVCPLETAKLAELAAILGDRVGKDVFLYSITIDPLTDTPEVLAAYAEMYGAGPGWTFLTGKGQDIISIRKSLGLYIEEIQGEESKDHNTSLIIGNQATGRWMKRSPFEDPYFLADQVGSWLHNWTIPSINTDSYANAPSLDDVTSGSTLFRTRCASCHVIGEQVSAAQIGRLIGPDLLGVTDRRDPEWLARWVAEPDKMLAEKDPLALQLFAQYKGVAMPNMSLSRKQVDSVLEYIETESRRVLASQAGVAARAEAMAASGGEVASCCQKGESALLASVDSADPEDSDSMHASVPDISPTFRYGSMGFGVVFLLLYFYQGFRVSNQPARGRQTNKVEIV